MASELYNNVSDTLALSVSPSDTEIVVSDGSKFTSPGGGNYFPIHVVRESGSFEIMHVTSVSGNTMSVLRSQEGTNPLAFVGNETVQLRPTRQSLMDFQGNVDSFTGELENISSSLNKREFSVESKTDLSSIDTSSVDYSARCYLSIGKASGTFAWSNSDLSAEVSSDAGGWVYIAPDFDPSGASGAWIRSDVRKPSPYMFGASGDGVSDDTSPINMCLSEYGVCYIQEGSFLCSGVSLSGTKIIGDGGIVVKSDSSEFSILMSGEKPEINGVTFNPIETVGQPNSCVKIGDGCYMPTIKNCVFECLSGSTYSAITTAEDPAAGGSDFPYSVNVKNLSISHNVFIGYTRPVVLLCVDGYSIANNRFTGCDFDALRIREVIGDGVVDSNLFIDVGDYSATDSQTRDAIDTAFSGHNLVISNNIIKRSAYVGIDLKGDSSTAFSGGTGNVVVTGNHIEGCKKGGISVGQSLDGFVITSNNIIDCNKSNESGGGGVGDAGILIKGGIKNVTISSNHVKYCHGRGIFLDSGDGPNENISIRGNQVVNNVDIGLVVSECFGVIVSENHITNDSSLQNPDEQSIGLSLQGTPSSTKSVIVKDNIIKGNTSSQVSLSGSGHYFDSVYSWSGNYEEGPNAYNTGSGFARFIAKQPRVLWGDGTIPSSTAGTFNRGDIIYFTSPSAGGDVGMVCVSSGSPGTWKNFGAIDA